MFGAVGSQDEQVIVAQEGNSAGSLAEFQFPVVSRTLVCVEVDRFAFDCLARLGVDDDRLRLVGSIDESIPVPAQLPSFGVELRSILSAEVEFFECEELLGEEGTGRGEHEE